MQQVHLDSKIKMPAVKSIKQLYTLPSVQHMEIAGTHRGNHHDRQDLGVWMPANTTLRVRQTNRNFKMSLKLKLFNDDSEHEKQFTISENGEWLLVSSEFDSVPFVDTIFDCSENPILELKHDCDVPGLPTFKINDDQKEFLQCWTTTDAAFVLLSSNRIQLLVPRKNRDFLQSQPANFIGKLLEFYEATIATYDELLGLSDDDPPFHHNVHTRYFLKADVHGSGEAYYDEECVASSYSDVKAFLKKGWCALHEIGHGYQGHFMSPKSKDDILLEEVWNNIYAHSFQVTYNSNDGWLFEGDRNKLERDTYMKRVGGKTYNEMSHREKLYFHIVLKEHTGDTAMIHFNREYRERQNRGRDGQSFQRTTDLLAYYWSEGARFDVVPYYEQYGLVVTDDCKEAIQNQDLELGCVLRDLVNSDDVAEKIRKATKLKTIYSIVRTGQMRNKGVQGKIVVNVDIAELEEIRGKSLCIMDGQNIIREASIMNRDKIVFDEMDAGVYLIRGPYAAFTPYHANSQRAIVSQDRNTTVDFKYSKVVSPFVQQFQILLQGLCDTLFATVTIFGGERKLKVDFSGEQPHDRYPNEHYASIILFDGPNLIYQVEFEGTTTGAFSKSFHVNNDCIIRVNHVEPNRVKFYNPVLQQYDDELVTMEEESTYTMTKYGLVEESWSDAHRTNSYIEKVNAFLRLMQEKIGSFQDEMNFAKERNQIHASILVLPEPLKDKYLEKYKPLILRQATSVKHAAVSRKKTT